MSMSTLHTICCNTFQLVVMTTPGNPSGAVCPKAMMQEIVTLCKQHSKWLLIDEAYQDFLHDGAEHYSPCAHELNYDNIVHISTFSKVMCTIIHVIKF
jgi:aspartate/methionine/tyrosine aminotransferase